MTDMEKIKAGKTSLGIEFGSTRIKAVLIDFKGKILATGFYDWRNSFVDGIWTYSIDEIHAGLRGCYSSLRKSVQDKYGVNPDTYGAIGVSAMMHGIMAFDKKGKILTHFQTWRNSNTQVAADKLSELFQFNIPLRWTVSHLYQFAMDDEQFMRRIDYVTVLSSYIHWKLTGERVVGIGDASGIFPINSHDMDYDTKMMMKFECLLAKKQYPWELKQILPKVLKAGEYAGKLTVEGAAFLDESGTLKAGIPFCPPEGDAGTGMVATNSVTVGTGNVSAGTSTFAMIVLEKPLSKVYKEIDMVATPMGYPVAMSHANNGTSDINAWMELFGEYSELMGISIDKERIFEKLFTNSLKGDPDCGNMLSYGYYSGEGIIGLQEGRPIFIRKPESRFTLANFVRTHLYSSLCAVKIGIDILMKDENVEVKQLTGHGGFFKTPGVGQRYLAAAVDTPVLVRDTADEGGAWGIALLAAYLICSNNRQISLADYLRDEVFSGRQGTLVEPNEEEVKGFEKYMENYRGAISVEEEAVEYIR